MMRERPQADADGFYDLDGVRLFARYRRCGIDAKSDLHLIIVFGSNSVSDTAIVPGLWDPVSILRACTAASGWKAYDVDTDTAIPIAEFHDEFRSARIVGVRPYLSRQGQHRREGNTARSYGRWSTRPASAG